MVEIDGSDVTNACIAGSWTPRLNRPAQAQVTMPMDLAQGDVGSRLKITIDGVLRFHGFILVSETDTNKDQGTTVYNAQDPMELWQWRPVRDDSCNFSQPSIITDYVQGPDIMQAALFNSTSAVNCGGTIPQDAEGPLFLDLGTFTSGSVSLIGAPVDWPMTIAELFSLLCSTGQVDLVITPTDPGGGVMGTVDGYPGNYGTDLSGSVIFQYGTGAHNVDSLRWNRDMTNVVNKYWIYGGPRVATAADPEANEHWCFNITGDDGGLAYPPGGALSPPASATNNDLGVKRVDSQVNDGPTSSGYGVRMKIDIFDAYDDNCIPGFGTPGRELYRRQWQEFSWISATPREIIHVTPTRETEIGTFGIGDLVGVAASADVRGGFSGAQRVYEYTISWDEDSVLALSELQTSADAEF